MRKFNVGDKIEVLDEGLAMLRRICSDQPPNHYGEVSEIWDNGNTLLILFDDTEQAAPYPSNLVRLR